MIIKMNNNHRHTPINMAWRDIHEHLEKIHKPNIFRKKRAKWVVTRIDVDTEETRQLNRELGIRGLNMTRNY